MSGGEEVDEVCFHQVHNDVVNAVRQDAVQGTSLQRYVPQFLEQSVVEVAHKEEVAHEVHTLDDAVLHLYTCLKITHALHTPFLDDGIAGVLAIDELVGEVFLLQQLYLPDIVLRQHQLVVTEFLEYKLHELPQSQVDMILQHVDMLVDALYPL